MTKNNNQLKEINTLIDEHFEKENAHLSVVFHPETNELNIGGDSKGEEFQWLGIFKCNPETIALLLTRFINDTKFITSNTEKQSNVFVEYGNYR